MTGLAKGAAILCSNPKVWDFMNFLDGCADVTHSSHAADWMRAAFEIDSRKRIDECGEAREKYLAFVAEFNAFLKGYGAIQKHNHWRSDDIRALASAAPCMRCQKPPGSGSVVGAHGMGMVAGMFGKGVGIKPDDFLIAYLRHDCHQVIDTYKNNPDEVLRTLELVMLILKTHAWLLTQGFMRVSCETSPGGIDGL